VASRDSTIASHGFSPDTDGSAREAPDTGPDAAAFAKENLGTYRAVGSLLDLVEGQTPLPASANPRAAPPPEMIAKAVEIARTYTGRGNSELHFVGGREARRLLDLFWPRHMERVYRCCSDTERGLTSLHWQSGFKAALDHEYAERKMFQERRRKWERDRERAEQQRQHDQRRLAITGGRAPARVEITPLRKSGPPRGKLAPGYRYVTEGRLAEIEARVAALELRKRLLAALNARRRELVLRGSDADVRLDAYLRGGHGS
jgi:hypothetical protein